MEWTNFYMLFFKKDKTMCRFKAMDKDPEDGRKKDVQTRPFLKKNVETTCLQHQSDAFTALGQYVYGTKVMRLRR
ncbi:hypothetical protein [Hallella multisaccharivorax]|nr:hypothetical protein [Hallella multisaccharivorax]